MKKTIFTVFLVVFALSECGLAQKTVFPSNSKEFELSVPIAAAAQRHAFHLLKSEEPRLRSRIDAFHCFESPDPLEQLAALNQTGQFRALKEKTECVLSVDGAPADFDPQKNYYAIVLAGTGVRSDPEIIRYILHRDGEAYSDEMVTTLPGIKDNFREVFLRNKPQSTALPMSLLSKYVFTKNANPLEDQAFDFTKQIVEAAFPVATLFTQNKTFQGTQPNTRGAIRPPAKAMEVAVLVARISPIAVPYSRATVEIEDVITASDDRVLEAIQKAATKLGASMGEREARVSPCARNLASTLPLEIARVTCPANGDSEACWKGLSDAVARGFATVSATSACQTIPRDDLPAFLAVDTKFKALVTAKDPKELTGTAKYTNVPLTRLSYGLVTSFIAANRKAGSRAKIDSDKVVRDPLLGNLTAAIVNIHFVPYDADSDRVVNAERFRWFAGAALTPNFGFVTGPSIAVIRSFSFNAGIGFLAIPVPRTGDSAFDKAPEPTPLKNGLSRAIFVGLGYSFK